MYQQEKQDHQDPKKRRSLKKFGSNFSNSFDNESTEGLVYEVQRQTLADTLTETKDHMKNPWADVENFDKASVEVQSTDLPRGKRLR